MKKAVLAILAIASIVVPIVAWTQVALFQFIWPLFLSQLTWLLGVVGFVLLLHQFVLASRLPLIERGVGQDKLFVAHRVTGIAAVSLILLHALSRTIYELLQHGEISLSFWKALGVFAFLLTAVAAFYALTYKRLSVRYEVFKRIHQANFVVLPLAFVHSMWILAPTLTSVRWMRYYWWALIGIWALVVFYRIGLWFYVRSRPYRIAEVRKENHDITSLFFDGPQIQYRPGQFMLVNVTINGRVSQAHPYTLSSSPTQEQPRISAKAIGDFSASLADAEEGASAFISAPFGEFTFLNHNPKSIVYLAGGIGITPFMSHLRYMRDKKLSIPVTLIWCNKSAKDIAFATELEELGKSLESFAVIHVMSADPEWQGETGFLTRDIVERRCSIDEETHVYLCGPPPMMSSASQILAQMGVPRRRVHQERFAL